MPLVCAGAVRSAPPMRLCPARPSTGSTRHADRRSTSSTPCPPTARTGDSTRRARWRARSAPSRPGSPPRPAAPNLRFDTYQGSLDVSFFRLAATDATVASRGAFVREAVEQELRAAGFDRPDRIYAVYYDGSSTYACGGAFWPPQLNGNAIVMYLRGRPSGAMCEIERLRHCRDAAHVLGVRDAARHPARARDGAHVRAAPSPRRARLRLRERPDVGGEPAVALPGEARHRPRRLLRPRPDRLRRPGAQPVPDDESAAAARARRDDVPRRHARASRARGSTQSSRSASTARAWLPGRRSARPHSARAPSAPSSVSFAASAARCRWRFPAGSKGKRFRGTVRAAVGSLSATRSFSRIVR